MAVAFCCWFEVSSVDWPLAGAQAWWVPGLDADEVVVLGLFQGSIGVELVLATPASASVGSWLNSSVVGSLV